MYPLDPRLAIHRGIILGCTHILEISNSYHLGYSLVKAVYVQKVSFKTKLHFLR